MDDKKWKTRINKVWKNIDSKNILSKFWITDNLLNVKTNSADEKLVLSLFIPKLYKCDVKCLELKNQIISFNELLFLSLNVEYLSLNQVIVKYGDGVIVPLEKIVEIYKKAKSVRYTCVRETLNITFKTFNELLKIPHFLTLDRFDISNIPDELDIELFYNFMKENKETKFHLRFFIQNNIAYKNRLESIIDEIIATKNFSYKPPVIICHGIPNRKMNKLQRISRKH
uniref:DUF38 domain-containing protein n=1 Tax=Panagrolaimus davidi TaxID=227884 RepID=A0A914QM67_9BILA